MQYSSDYDILQKRIENRGRKRNRLFLWLALTVVMGLFAVIGGQGAVGCAVPLMILTGGAAVMTGIDVFYTRRAPKQEQIEAELRWLFGDDWAYMAGTQEYAFAQERIHKRKVSRWQFIFHLIIFLPLNFFIVYMTVYNFTQFNWSPPGWIFIPSMFWLFILIRHWLIAFPSRSQLARREERAGQALQREREQLAPMKVKEKPKHDLQFALDEDGELIDLDVEDEKPKRDQISDL